MPRVLPIGTKGFLVAGVTAAESSRLWLDGRALDDEVRVGDRFVELHLVEVDEQAGTSSYEPLCAVDIVVTGIETYGRSRSFLGPAMTGRLEVDSRGDETPFADTMLVGSVLPAGALTRP